MRVLLAETTWNTMSAATGLDQAGLLVTRTDTGAELLDFAKFGEQSAIVLDLDIPDMDASKLIRALRAKHPLLPIYALSESSDWAACKPAYEAGADVVLTGAVDVPYLAAHIKAAVRRQGGYAQGLLSIGCMTVDTAVQSVAIGDVALRLTRKEYEIVELLALHQGTLVTRELFMNHLYAWNDEPDARIINVYLSRIRNQIGKCGGDPEMLETVWGLGYRLNAQGVAQAAA